MCARAVLFVLSNLLLIVGAAQVVPLGVAALCEVASPMRSEEMWVFGLNIAGCLTVGLLGRVFFRPWAERVQVREGFAIVTFAWLLMTAVGMVPYWGTGVVHGVADAFFETMSGFTTTGATIFADLRPLPPAIQFWRCMTQWLGGMGVVVLSVALLPMLGVGGYRLLKAESPGGMAYERERPRVTDAAKELWKLYLLLSLLLFVCLLLSGLSVFDAICHTFSTMSTGGFSPHNASVGHFANPWIHWIIILFMFLAGANFSVHGDLLRGRFVAAFANPEFRFYAILLASCGAIAALVAPPLQGGIEPRIRHAVFQVVSIVTTTGFGTEDYDAWPEILRLLLVCLMFVGGSMGSTSGGIKVARVLIYIKSLVRELHKLIFPHALRPMRVGLKVVQPHIVSNILAFGMVYVAAFVFGTAVLASFGYDLATSLSASASALGNVGPGLGAVGPTANWGHLPDLAKWATAFLMLLGRLEVYSVLVLFTPWAWKR